MFCSRFVLGPDSGLRRPVAVAMTPRSSKLVLVQSDGVVKVFSYADTKVKMKVPCWCPRCSTSTDDGDAEGEGQTKQDQGRIQVQGHPKYQGRLNGRSRASSVASSGSGSGGAGSRGSRTGSESYGPLSPSSPVFHTPHLNGRMRKY
ncbi:hypothetical protein ElyMa_002696800 [Elysia marginata]|uniref:Uncharacterized protein n=1 Tax=Elysia marginata TaxID=1093978 RepID=A0AAV4HC98_9GAST|nr:hypothetical protein ElyMa_002696800 [Elysia marginata]